MQSKRVKNFIATNIFFPKRFMATLALLPSLAAINRTPFFGSLERFLLSCDVLCFSQTFLSHHLLKASLKDLRSRCSVKCP